MAYNTTVKINNNIEAVRIALCKKDINNEDINKLKLFSGWGGIKCVLCNPYNDEEWANLSENDKKLRNKVIELHDLLKKNLSEKKYKDAINSIKNATLTSFYTPSIICSTFFQILSEFTDIKLLYEPSAGSGVFITEALKVFPDMKLVEVCEKDMITNKILSALLPPNIGKTRFYIQEGFEDTDILVDGMYDLLATNPPYGDISIYDEEYQKDKIKKEFCKRIHNYFVAKSIDKLRDGGIGAWLITNSFLDTVSNSSIRRYLFERCDFISLVVMPDNLMWETGGTMAPSHFLVVQKNSSKTCLSPEEELLIESSFIETSVGKYAVNNYIQKYNKPITPPDGNEIMIATDFRDGKNQYGKPSPEIRWNHPIEEIAEPFREILLRDFTQRFKKEEIVDNCDKELDINEQVFDELTDYYIAKEDLHSKAIDIAIEQSGLSDIFKPRSEWLNEDGTIKNGPVFIDLMTGEKINKEVEDYTNSPGVAPNNIQKFTQEELKELLPEYVPFKNGIIVEYGKDK